MTQLRYDLRPLDYGGLLDRAFDLYRHNFSLFFSIASVVLIPLAIIQMLGPLMQKSRPTADDALVFVGFTLLFVPIYMFLALLVQAALTLAISNRYLGLPSTLGSAWAGARKALWPLLATGFMAGMLMLIGTILCVIPGIYVAFIIAFVTPVVMLEHRYYSEAISRSQSLVGDGQWVRVLVTWLLLFLINMAVLMLQGGVQALFMFTLGPESSIYVNAVFQAVVNVLIMPITLTVTVLLYYDIRVRKEAFDLQMLAAAIGVPYTPAYPQGYAPPGQYPPPQQYAPPSQYAPTLPGPPPAAPPPTIDGTVRCSACSAVIPAVVAFCTNCGAPQPR
ncbi:MAG: zinc ribbon domain-containing protein [Armatimonadetes bacterium]|nr:zinc ribbon domain-containing protein [Armatimonadota bacterium]